MTKIYTIPYLPLPYLRKREVTQKYSKRPQAIISMQSANDSIANSQRLGFEELGRTLIRIKKERKIELLVSRGEESAPLPVPSYCRVVDFSQPEDIYRSIRAIATLSKRGYGTKTSVMDAIGIGLWAMVHPKIYKRIPKELRSACIAIDPRSLRDVERSLEQLKSPPSDSKVALKLLKARTMKSLFSALNTKGTRLKG